MPLDVVSNTDEKVAILVNPTRANGQPATLDGRPTLSITAGAATVQNLTQEEADAFVAEHPEAAGIVGFLVSEDGAGASSWEVTGDADLGSGVTPITESGTYVYSAAPAVNIGVKSLAFPK